MEIINQTKANIGDTIFLSCGKKDDVEKISVSYTHLRAHETGRNVGWRRGG